MLRILAVTAAAAALAAPLATPSSADGVAKGGYKAAYEAKPACAQFGGFYLGGNFGSAYYDATLVDRDNLISPGASVHSSYSGLMAGGQIGFNLQNGCSLFGFEADWSWTDASGSKDYQAGGNTLLVRSGTESIATLRSRAGVVVDKLMIYATTGLALSSFDARIELGPTGAPPTTTVTAGDSRWGWVAGFGTEIALSDRLSLKSEALYLRFVDDTSSHQFTGLPGNFRFDHQDGLWVGRVGLNIRLGGDRGHIHDAGPLK